MCCHDQSALVCSAISSKSAGWPRTYIRPLTDVEPPSTLPRVHGSDLPPVLASGAVGNGQVYLGFLIIMPRPFGIAIIGCLCLGPASSSARSDESRVGKECLSTCRSWWSPFH